MKKIRQILATDSQYIIKYAIVGGIGTIIDVGGFAFLIKLTSINKYLAATISFVAAMINNFTWNKIWTFKNTCPSIAKQYGKFVFVSTSGLILNLFFLWILRNILSWITHTSIQELPIIANTFAKLCAISIVSIFNFLMNRYWTFYVRD